MLNFFISGTFHEWWQTYHERWLDWNRRSNFLSKSKSQIWKRMMEFFIISVNKQLPSIGKNFGAKNQKFKETECFSWVVTKFSWVMTRASSNFPGAQTYHEWWQICHEWWHAGWALFSWCLNDSICIKCTFNSSFSLRGHKYNSEINQWSWASTFIAKSWAINLEINFQPPRHSSLICVSSFYLKSVLEFGLLGI